MGMFSRLQNNSLRSTPSGVSAFLHTIVQESGEAC